MKPFIALGSPAGSVLASREGYRPLGAVVGVSVVNLQSPSAQGGLDGTERRVQTDAVDLAVANVMMRARDRAKVLGACGVVGVRLDIPLTGDRPWIEVRLSGTAVANGTDDGREKPFLTNLGGCGLTALRATGHDPVGLAVGTCFYRQVQGYRTTNAMAESRGSLGYGPFEHPDFTRAVGQARAIAMERLRSCATGSDGIVAVELRTEIHRSGDAMDVDFIVVGTAIRQTEGREATPPLPTVVLLR